MIKHRLRRLESFLNDCQLRLHKPPPRRLQTVQDVIVLLQEQVEAVRADRQDLSAKFVLFLFEIL